MLLGFMRFHHTFIVVSFTALINFLGKSSEASLYIVQRVAQLTRRAALSPGGVELPC